MAPLDAVMVTAPYDQVKDFLLGAVSIDKWTPVRFSEGQIIILYPTDAYAPSLAVNQLEDIKKIVIKIALDS